jgi:bifunctional enzyme CysN/CysC
MALEDLFPHTSLVGLEERRKATKQIGLTLWITGLSGSGKTTLAVNLEKQLVADGIPAYVLDGDTIRSNFTKDLGFSDADRKENIRIAGELAMLLNENGVIAIVSLVSPFRQDRTRVLQNHEGKGLYFKEIYVSTPIEICESRDTKGLYAKARQNRLENFTGITSVYEPPLSPYRSYNLTLPENLHIATADIYSEVKNLRMKHEL